MQVAYFGEPIDQDPRLWSEELEREHVTREALVSRIAGAGYSVFRPATAWQAGFYEDAPEIETVNRAALDEADIGVFRLPEGTRSVGVPMEIEAMAERDKPVIVHTESASVSLAARENVTIVDNIEEFERVFEVVKKMPSSKVNIKMRVAGRVGQDRKPGDAGFDLTVAETTGVPPNGWGLIPCGAAVQLPEGMFAWIVGRSSTFKTYGLHVLPGIIDTGYRGDLFVSVHNTTDLPVEVAEGKRIAQMVVLPNYADVLPVEYVDQIKRDTERGDNGFGSTGA